MQSASPSSSREAPERAARLRDRLRAETRVEHEKLDALFADMLEPGQEDLYASFLRTNRAGHAAVEPLLDRGPLRETAPDWSCGSRLEALEDDCRTHALAPLGAPSVPLPGSGLPEALGMAYVLEGSRLGAAFLLKALRRQTPGSETRSTRYLEVSSDPEPFRRVIGALNAVSLSNEEADRMIVAANQTFRYFRALAEGARTGMTTS